MKETIEIYQEDGKLVAYLCPSEDKKQLLADFYTNASPLEGTKPEDYASPEVVSGFVILMAFGHQLFQLCMDVMDGKPDTQQQARDLFYKISNSVLEYHDPEQPKIT